MSRNAKAFVLVFASQAALAACGTDSFVLAERDPSATEDAGRDAGDPSDDAGALEAGAAVDAGAGEPVACTSSAECAAHESCERASCGAAFGQCTPQRFLCDDAPDPVCGCNGITYFNDCLRRRDGVALLEEGECSRSVIRCDAETACPAGAYCAYLLRNENACADARAGVCWVVPASCAEPRFGGDRFASCGAGAACVDACTAIQRETPHVLQRRCERPMGTPGT
ncbi:MAG: hypothetical protein RL385_5347 [Pseudomonadota bacterium]|jgi:hypothetical protein